MNTMTLAYPLPTLSKNSGRYDVCIKYSATKPKDADFNGCNVTVRSVFSDGVVLRLLEPLRIVIRREGGYYMTDYPQAHIYIAEDSLAEARQMFDDEFVYAWLEYAEEEDARLSPGAQRVKRWLLSHAEREK